MRLGEPRSDITIALATEPETGIGWGTTDPRAEALAAALIGDALGGRPVDDELVALFVKDVVGSLPVTGFELPAAEIRRWLAARLRPTP